MPKKSKKKTLQVSKSQIKNPKGYALVEIEWIDSAGPGVIGWCRDEDLESFPGGKLTPLSCFTCGYVVNDAANEDFINVAGSIGGSGTLGLISIPKCSILKIYIIKNEREIQSV